MYKHNIVHSRIFQLYLNSTTDCAFKVTMETKVIILLSKTKTYSSFSWQLFRTIVATVKENIGRAGFKAPKKLWGHV